MKRIKDVCRYRLITPQRINFAAFFSTLIFVLSLTITVDAQTTVFTYQGKLNESGAAATAVYDLQFKLFDAATAGNQIGAAQIKTNVQPAAGIFTVELDFGASFNGDDRWLEVSVSRAGQNNFTTLAPRQKLTSAPYSIQAASAATAANSLRLGGAAANQFVQTNDNRLSDARDPLPGSGNYVQNTDAAQPSVNFNIGGTGTANVLNAATQFNLAGARILSNSGSDNLFAGVGAGTANTGAGNSFFGAAAGSRNMLGSRNSFFGSQAGFFNTSGSENTGFGAAAGFNIISGSKNSYFGRLAGRNHSSGNSNTFVGFDAHRVQLGGGDNNTLLGANTAISGEISNNTIVGANAATSGSNNTILGANASIPLAGTNNSVAIGSGVTVSTSNTIVIGTDAQTTQIPGITILGDEAKTFNYQNAVNGIIAGNFVFRNFNIHSSPSHLCFRSQTIGGNDGGWGITNCTSSFSSASNKTDVQPFSGGLEVIKQLKPIAFKWKIDGAQDFGLNAEDVAEIAPEIVERGDKGEIRDVRENSLNVFFINAFKEQQRQIEAQTRQIEQQKKLIDGLKKLLCETNSQAEICREP